MSTRRSRRHFLKSVAGTTVAAPILLRAQQTPIRPQAVSPNERIGIALVEEGSARAAGAAPPRSELAPGARLTGKVDRHEKFGVFVFLTPGRIGLMPLSETGLTKEADVLKAFPVGSDVEVVVLEVDPAGRRIRVSRKAMLDAGEAEEVREYNERSDASSAEGFGSLADQLRGALEPKEK